MASRRQYLSQTELAEFSDITISDSGEADDQIDMAEEMIDAYVGPQNSHVKQKYEGKATGGTSTTLIDTSGNSPLDDFEDDYFTYCEVEIIGGTSSDDFRTISSYDKSTNTITVSSAFSSTPDTTTVYIIRQLGKFPRVEDARKLSEDDTYYKTIPENVRRAVAAQVEYIIEKGLDFFAGSPDLDSEGLGDYNYSVKENADRMISPHARRLLRGFANRKGRLVAPNPTNL